MLDKDLVQHLPSFAHHIVLSISSSIGFPADQLLLVFCLLLSIPIGQLHRQISSVTCRHLFSTFVGLLYGYVVYGSGLVEFLLLVSVTYILVLVLPYQHAPLAVALWSLLFLSFAHLRRMSLSYLGWNVDVTTSLMVGVVKCWCFAYSYSDGVRLSMNSSAKLHSSTKVHEYLTSLSLAKFPTPLEFFSFMLFYGGFLTGPCFHMRNYIDFQSGDAFRHVGLSSTPATLFPSLIRVFYAFLCFPLMYLCMYTPVLGFVTSTAFTEFSLIDKSIYTIVAVSLYRYKYYLAWYLAEAGCISAGLGFNYRRSTQEHHVWDSCSNVSLTHVEFHCSVLWLTNNWNKFTNDWLKNFVFFRVNFAEKSASLLGGHRFLRMVTTRFVSAFWHGFYSAYYLFFLSILLVNYAENSVQLAIGSCENLSKGGKLLINYIRYIGTAFLMNYFGVSFILLQAGLTWSYWKNMHFIGHVLCLIIWHGFSSCRTKEKYGLKKEE